MADLLRLEAPLRATTHADPPLPTERLPGPGNRSSAPAARRAVHLRLGRDRAAAPACWLHAADEDDRGLDPGEMGPAMRGLVLKSWE